MGGKFALFSLFFLSVSWVTCNASNQVFYQCMSMQPTKTNTSAHLFTPNSPTYGSLLYAAQQNTRWTYSAAPPKPVLIFTPGSEAEIQAAVICCQKSGLLIRVKSGGHDYEGMSYLSEKPYIIIDLTNFRTVNVDAINKTAWVQTGATLGELYYNIGKANKLLGFPGGLCPSVGTGGHISGGGMGMLGRKYGLAADNVIDARLVDVKGRILDRRAMGEDLFWALRGSGGASFGVIVAWKLRLVDVPPTVTAFTIDKTLAQGVTKLIQMWQDIAHQLDDRLLIRVLMSTTTNRTTMVKTAHATFNSLFLGPASELLPLMEKSFPQLGLTESDCKEMSWIQSALYFYSFNYTSDPLESLLNRTDKFKQPYKGKSDYVQTPLSEAAIEGVWAKFFKTDAKPFLIMDPYGGEMSEILETALPFPHRQGNLYNIQYLVKWKEIDNNQNEAKEQVDWLRDLYTYMEPFVSKNPRAAYINYKDLDLGVNQEGKMTYEQGKVWGEKYFKGNFERLARVKAQVDPQNIFRNAQSIPPFPK